MFDRILRQVPEVKVIKKFPNLQEDDSTFYSLFTVFEGIGCQ